MHIEAIYNIINVYWREILRDDLRVAGKLGSFFSSAAYSSALCVISTYDKNLDGDLISI